MAENEEAAPAEAKNEAEASSGGASVGVMKEGEYLLHVLIETGKNISLEGEDTVDPLIKVSFMGKNKQTTAKDNCTRSTQMKWDEHLFLETGKVGSKEVEEGLIEIEILNKGFFKSDLIGYFPISAPTIYNMKEHLVHNQQLAFTNPLAEDKARISGYVTVSIQLTGPGDSAS